MFEIGDYVIYGDSGLCQVEQIGIPGRMSGAEESVLKKTEYQLCAELAAALKLSYDDARALVLQSLKAQTES